MKSRRTTLKAALALFVVGLGAAVSVSTLARAVAFYPREPEAPASPAMRELSARPQASGMRVRIPTIGVDAAVQHVGVAKSGKLAVPSNYSDAGWYRYGPIPGEPGAAVMDGHVDNGFGRKAVFSRLGELQPGDAIMVDTAQGEKEFVVEDVVRYKAEDVPLETLFQTGGAARLNLITCDGTWDKARRSYDERLVVYARLVR